MFGLYCPPCELLCPCPVKCSFSVLWAPIRALAWRVSGCGLLVLWALRAALTCHSCPSTLENSLEVQPKVGNCFSSNQQIEYEKPTTRLRAPKGPWTSSLTQRHTSSSFQSCFLQLSPGLFDVWVIGSSLRGR